MSLQNKIKNDLKEAIKAKDNIRKDTIRVIMGEFARADTKEIADEDVIKILKKLIKSEKEVIERQGGTENSEFINIVEAYLPQMATTEAIEAWIKANIDFSEFKNKMQAMKPIMQHFGSSVDGNTVKGILQNL